MYLVPLWPVILSPFDMHITLKTVVISPARVVDTRECWSRTCLISSRFFFATSDPPTQLKIRHIPVPLTCGVFDGAIITDPSLLEEELVTTHITVVSTAAGQVCVAGTSFT